MELDKYSLLTKSLRTRASRFRYVAYFALIGSVIILATSIYLFLNASELSLMDNVNLLKFKTIQLRELTNQRDNLAMELKGVQQRFQEEITEGYKNLGIGPVAVQLQRRMDDLALQLKIMDDRIAKQSNILTNEKQNELSISQVVTTSVTRFMVLGTVIFLVQILINLYKYNMRVAGHYKAVADALDLSKPPLSEDNFISIAELLSPNKIDFGTIPNSIVDHAFDLLKVVSRK